MTDPTNKTTSNGFKNDAHVFDPFGSLGGGDGSNILGGWSNFSTAPVPNVAHQNNLSEQKSDDPFAGLGKYHFTLIIWQFDVISSD